MVGYLRYFLKDPKVASIVPTRKKIVANICAQIDFKTSRHVIEYGPGLGVISKQILENLHKKGHFFVFETNRDMASALTQKLKNRQLTVFNQSALDACDYLPPKIIGEVDTIVSGIPLSMLTEKDRRELFITSYDLLKPGGLLLIYQVIPMFKNLIGHNLTPDLSEFFKELRHHDEVMSIPPLRIYLARK